MICANKALLSRLLRIKRDIFSELFYVVEHAFNILLIDKPHQTQSLTGVRPASMRKER